MTATLRDFYEVRSPDLKRWGMVGVAVLMMSGCSENRRVHLGVLGRGEPLDEIVIHTVDGRIIELEDAFLHRGTVMGEVASCNGAPVAANDAPAARIAGRDIRYRKLTRACAKPGEHAAIEQRAVERVEVPKGQEDRAKVAIAAAASRMATSRRALELVLRQTAQGGEP